MGALVRLLGVVVAATLLSGCSNLAWMFVTNDPSYKASSKARIASAVADPIPARSRPG